MGASRLPLIVAVAACGRLHFDPVAVGDGGGDTGDAAIDSRLVAWYTFEDGLAGGVTKDMTGHGHDAACDSGFTCPSVSPGRTGGFALSGCSATAPGLLVPDMPALRLAGQLTIAGWMRWTDNTSFASIVSKPVGAATADSYQLDVDMNGIVRVTTGDGNSSSRLPASLPVIFDQWVHVAGVDDGAMLHIYVAGLEAAGPSTAIAAGYDTQPLVLCSDRNSGASAESFGGMIADVRIYNAALSATEIAALASM